MRMLLAEIEEDINWRVSEIANIKTIPVRYNLLEAHKQTLTLYSVPSIYALWEGFLKNTFELLTNFINKIGLDSKTVHLNLLTHAIENKCKLGNERKYFEKKLNLVEMFSEIYDSPLQIEQGIPTESNVNYKVTNKILERFNIQELDISFEKPLNRLLLFRNKIAHGENSIKVTRNDINEFSLLAENLMCEILILIESCLKNSDYKKVT
ncbi:MAG: hypothetical protein JEY96_16740 [Bacteroidales bacterium]|nr:hypothetical protein [Bacteroidales bacterium]